MSAVMRGAGQGRAGGMPASIPARLTFETVTHRYDEVASIEDLSLDVAAGEVVCLVGPSGCGKTTLLRLAAGLERPASGRILLNDREVSGPDVFLLPEKRGVGLMFQDYALFPHMTNLANVMFGLKNLTRAEAAQEGRLGLERVGLASYADLYPHMLSGGEQQRVALARAVAPRPSALLFDEPFSGLDRQLRHRVREDTLAAIRETRATCLIVTHDPEEAMRMGDRLVLMRAGRIVQSGSAEQLYRYPVDVFAARFFCELNEIAGVVRQGRVETPLGAFDAPGFGEGAPVIVCIRPQGVRLVQLGEGTAGRVIAAKFLGEVDHLDIAVEGLGRPLIARLRANLPLPAPRADIGVFIDPGNVLVFAADTA